MSKIATSSPIDLLIRRFFLFLRLLGLDVPARVGEEAGSKGRGIPNTSARTPPRCQLPPRALSMRILAFLRATGEPVRKTDVLQHVAKVASLDAINRTLARLARRGLVESHVARGQPGRPAELWSAVAARPALAAKSAVRQVAAPVARKLLKAAEAEGLGKPANVTVASMGIEDLAKKILVFLAARRKATSRQEIAGHLGHKVAADRINAALACLALRKAAMVKVMATGRGRPAQLWKARGRK
jgi:predicted ArsR family transcriptional regulator